MSRLEQVRFSRVWVWFDEHCEKTNNKKTFSLIKFNDFTIFSTSGCIRVFLTFFSGFRLGSGLKIDFFGDSGRGLVLKDCLVFGSGFVKIK